MCSDARAVPSRRRPVGQTGWPGRGSGTEWGQPWGEHYSALWNGRAFAQDNVPVNRGNAEQAAGFTYAVHSHEPRGRSRGYHVHPDSSHPSAASQGLYLDTKPNTTQDTNLDPDHQISKPPQEPSHIPLISLEPTPTCKNWNRYQVFSDSCLKMGIKESSLRILCPYYHHRHLESSPFPKHAENNCRECPPLHFAPPCLERT